MKHKNQK